MIAVARGAIESELLMDRRALERMTEISDRRETQTVDHPPQQEQQQELIDAQASDLSPATELTDRAPYPTRLRMILVLSLLCWAVLAFAVAALIRLL